VPKTTGQGIARLSYQKGYGLAHNPNAPTVKSPFTGSSGGGGSRDYSKVSASPVPAPAMNVSYDDTGTPLDPSSMGEIASIDPLRKPRGPVKPSVSLTPRPARQLK
jgi:hypothetical protein